MPASEPAAIARRCHRRHGISRNRRARLGRRSEATLGAVDFLAQVDDALRFQYVSDASIEFIGYHRDYLSSC